MTPAQEVQQIVLANANLPRRYDVTMLETCRQHDGWAKAFVKLAEAVVSTAEGNAVVLCGGRGTGKTQMAAELIRRAAEELHFFSHYEVFLDYLDTVRRINDQAAADDHEIRYLAPRIVVIDEIAKAGDSAWAEQRLFHLVNARYNDLKHTILITAAPPEHVPAIVGPSVADRINEGGLVIHLDWPSFRSNQPKKP